MKNIAVGHSSGFMSIKLLAVGVIAVSFVVAVVVVENLIGGIFERASVTICFENPDIDWPPIASAGEYEEDMFFGDVLVQCPKSTNINESVSVSVTLMSRDYAVSESDVDGQSTDEETYYALGEHVDLYPKMYAELQAGNFDMEASSTGEEKLVSPGSRTTWTWVISPKTVGNQRLAVEVKSHVRVQIQGYEGEAAKSVYHGDFDILVEELRNLGYFEEHAKAIVGIISSIIAAIGLAIGLRKKSQKRTETQNDAKVHLP